MCSPRLTWILWAGGVVVACLAAGCGAGSSTTADAVKSSTVADRQSRSVDASDTTLFEAAAGASAPADTSSTTGPGPNVGSAGITPRPSQGSRSAGAPPLATAAPGRPDRFPTTTLPAGSDAGPTNLDRAVAARDLCALYDALGELEISGRTVSEFRAGMATVLAAVIAARSFVADELAETWSVLVGRTEHVVEVLSEPGASVSAAAEAFADESYRDAMERVDAWEVANCG